MKKQKIVILTGAGMSAESGIKTFRDAGGLWGKLSGPAGGKHRRV